MRDLKLSFKRDIGPFVALGLPLVGSNVANMLITMTDTIMVGWYDVTALAAITLAGGLFFEVFIFGAGFAFVLMPMISSALSENNDVRVRRLTRMTFWLSTGYFVLVFPLFWWSEQVFLVMGQTAELSALSQDYLRIAGIGMLPALWIMTLRSYLSAKEWAFAVMILSLTGVALNVVMNYAFIFGNLGAPELGLKGAALASLTVNALGFFAFAILTHYKSPEYALFSRLWRPDYDALTEVFRLGLPVGLTNIAEAGLFAASTVMAGWVGTVPLAAHGIALQLTALTFMFHVGMSQAASIRAGRAFGRLDEIALRKVAFSGYSVTLSFGILIILLYILIPDTMALWFLDPQSPETPEVVAVTVTLLLMAAAFQTVDSLQVLTISLLRGVHDTKIPMWLAMISYWAIGLPTCYVAGFVFDYGIAGIWLGLIVGLAAAAFTLSYRFWGYAVKIDKVNRPHPVPAA